MRPAWRPGRRDGRGGGGAVGRVRTRLAVPVGLALVTTAWLNAGCDACVGVAGCLDAPVVAASGVVLNNNTHAPVEGAVARFEYRYGPGIGPELRDARLVDTTDAEGRYSFSATGDVSADIPGVLRVELPPTYHTPPPRETILRLDWRKPEQEVAPVLVLPRPLIRARGEVLDEATGRGIAGVTVLYRFFTGPLPYSGGDSVTAVTDADGTYTLFTPVTAYGSTTGRLSFLLPPPSATKLFEPVFLFTGDTEGFLQSLGTTYLVQPGFVRARGRLVDETSGEGVAGASVSFRSRTGPPTAPSEPSAVTDSEGYYLLVARAGAVGGLVGTIAVTPPAPYAAVAVPEVFIPATADPAAVWNTAAIGVNPSPGS